MKKANEIINHLLKPFDKKIEIHRCLRKIISLMPKNYKNYITNIAIKNETLYIFVTHPAIKQELFFKRKMIFDIIKIMHKNNLCLNINPKKIVTINKYTPPLPPAKEIKFFIKKAGDFEIRAKNEKIKQKFEEIKEILKGKN